MNMYHSFDIKFNKNNKQYNLGLMEKPVQFLSMQTTQKKVSAFDMKLVNMIDCTYIFFIILFNKSSS